MSDTKEKSFDSESSDTGLSQKVTRTLCRQCFELVDIGDNFCRHCGGLTETGAAMVQIGRLPSPASATIAQKPLRWTESPVVVLLAMFVFIGPLAIPMLWRSRRFTRAWKIGLTVAVLLVTVAVGWYAVAAVRASIEPTMQELRRSGLL